MFINEFHYTAGGLSSAFVEVLAPLTAALDRYHLFLYDGVTRSVYGQPLSLSAGNVTRSAAAQVPAYPLEREREETEWSWRESVSGTDRILGQQER